MDERKKEERMFHDKLRDENFGQRWSPELEKIIQENPMWSNMKFYSIERKSRNFVLNWLSQNCKNKKILDYCCGNGEDAIFVAKNGAEEIIGIDISEKNIETARSYSDQLKMNNVEFRKGNVEEVPLPKENADIVLANCVFNLQDDKQKVADEMYRICDHNALACVSDFVVIHDIPEGLRKDGAELAGCIGGAENIDTFMNYFRKTGFQNVEVVEMKKVHLPMDVFEKHLSAEDVQKYKDVNSDKGIFSVTLIGEKPATCASETCCGNPDKHKN